MEMSEIRYFKNGEEVAEQLFNANGSIKRSIQNHLKNHPTYLLKIPNDVVFDNEKKKLIRAYTQAQLGKEFPSVKKSIRDGIAENPKRFILPNNQVYNLDSGQFQDANLYFDASFQLTNTKAQQGWVNYEGSNRVITQKINKAFDGGFDGVVPMYDVPKVKNEGATVSQIYNIYGDGFIPQDLDDLSEIIMSAYENDFSNEDKTRQNRKILLLFGSETFRWFPLEVLEDLEFAITNYAFQDEQKQYGGSDPKDLTKTNSLITPQNLDMTYFRISLSGNIFVGCEEFNQRTAKYWYLEDNKSTNNLCLESAIKRFLKLKERATTIRQTMTHFGVGVLENVGVRFEVLALYELTFEINIDVYEDTKHRQIQDGEWNDCANLVRKSKGGFDTTMRLLYRNQHFNLIKKAKKRIENLTKEQYEQLGVCVDEQEFYDKVKAKERKDKYIDNNPQASKDDNLMKQLKKLMTLSSPKEDQSIAVIFDNETVFNKTQDQFLEVYGVSWFVWDFNEHFDYESGWNDDKTENIYHNEPYCYYYNGDNCIDYLIKFLMNPPKGKKYRPMGFNNSRFDNFSFCEAAKKVKVLNDLFIQDGSILKCCVEGALPNWDASRFLPGLSLDSACKSYKTNPKKAKDLINHYEIQSYYEQNGMSGLVKLLNEKDEYILYNKIDCICLCDLIQKMRAAYDEISNVDIFNYLTISSMAYQVQKKIWEDKDTKQMEIISRYGGDHHNIPVDERQKVLDEYRNYFKFDIINPYNYDDDLNFRKSLTAGRTQSFFGKIDLNMELAMVDYKSLYPTIMGSYINDYMMPYGAYHTTKEWKKEKLGIYRVDINHQNCIWKDKKKVIAAFKHIQDETGENLFKNFAPNVIPKREKDKPLDWFFKGRIEDIWLTTTDMECLIWATEDEDCLTIHNGYWWEGKRKDLFVDFLEPLRQTKTNEDKLKAQKSPLYNPARREGVKLKSNSLSGKMLEKLHSDIELKFNIKNYNKMEDDLTITDIEINDYGGGLTTITGKKSERDVFNDLKEKAKKPSHIGMFIYSHSRTLMYKSLLSRYACLYMDTDSACMPLKEWERCQEENKDNNNIETGEYGCLEEEVCYTFEEDYFCKANGKTYLAGTIIPANRLMGISPKNYAVLNDEGDCILRDMGKDEYNLISKRKFKGVRKTDFFLPLSWWGSYSYDADGNLVGEALDKMRLIQKDQDKIRRMREFGCCVKCVDKKIFDNTYCGECSKWKKIMKPAYSTRMFEHLVNKEPIAVFCSMICRIVSKTGKDTSNEEIEEVGNMCSVKQLEDICCGKTNSDLGISMTITSYNIKKWEAFKKMWIKQQGNPHKFGTQEGKDRYKKLIDEFKTFHNRFSIVSKEKELKEMFKLRQTYMIKLIK